MPRLIAPSDLTAAVKTGGPSMTADADADAVGSGAQPLSSGELLSEPLMLLYTHAAADKSSLLSRPGSMLFSGTVVLLKDSSLWSAC